MKRISGATAISHLATILLVATLTVVFNTTNGAETWALAFLILVLSVVSYIDGGESG
jgi:uncharacterized membrane protein YgaE (UPF0421/DUF939 family)